MTDPTIARHGATRSVEESPDHTELSDQQIISYIYDIALDPGNLDSFIDRLTVDAADNSSNAIELGRIETLSALLEAHLSRAEEFIGETGKMVVIKPEKRVKILSKQLMAGMLIATGSMFAALIVGCQSIVTHEDTQMTKKTLVQEVLDLPELQQYYHTDQLPERRPLRLVCTDTACKETPLEKFGEPVEVLSQIPDGNQPYLAITQIEHNGTSAHIEFTYPPEGVAGTVVLKMKDEAWQVTESDVFEN